jgi:superfamily I DNA and RNA helicase
MEFCPHEPLTSNSAERYTWDSLKTAFREDPQGIAYYRYQIFPRGRQSHREPDILLLHPGLGVYVLECKGCRIDNVLALDGSAWRMQNWHEETETPLLQAEDQMFAVKNRYEDRRETRGLLSFHFAVALPFITRAEWEARGFHRLTDPAVLLRDDLKPGAFRESLRRLAAHRPQQPLSPEQWEQVTMVLRGILPGESPRPVPTGTAPGSPVRLLRAVEEQLKVLDQEQNRVAFQVPDGPQRVRGLAGTGKTVLFAQRAAKMHACHPDWDIAFVFFTKSLYEHVRSLIERFYDDMTGGKPDWRKLQVLHAWGGKYKAGMYSTLARATGRRALDARTAQARCGSGSPGKAFAYACKDLEGSGRVPEIFDAVLIDEGQDVPPEFYRLVLGSLRPPKRLYWAYDEAQGVGSLLVPAAEQVFGRDGQGNLVVDVAGRYEGGIDKSHKFRCCYRTPQLLLMVAHAVNMGLLRAGGPLQGVTTKEGWRDLGYEVEGDFRKTGTPIKVHRPAEMQRHPVDRIPGLQQQAGCPLLLKTFNYEAAEAEWVADQVRADLEAGLQPSDLLVTAIAGDHDQEYLEGLADAIKRRGVKVWVPGSAQEDTLFRMKDHVTVANLNRAKGNEAWKVYACRFHYATRPLEWRQQEELHKRNEGFVALTRARMWCVATGVEGPIFDEMRRAVEQQPYLSFAAFTQGQLRRRFEETAELAEPQAASAEPAQV